MGLHEGRIKPQCGKKCRLREPESVAAALDLAGDQAGFCCQLVIVRNTGEIGAGLFQLVFNRGELATKEPISGGRCPHSSETAEVGLDVFVSACPEVLVRLVPDRVGGRRGEGESQ